MPPVAIFNKDSEVILYILTFLRVLLRIPSAIKSFERQQMPRDTRQLKKHLHWNLLFFLLY